MFSMSRVKGDKRDTGKRTVIPIGDGRETAHKWLNWLNAGGKRVVGAFDDYNHYEIRASGITSPCSR